MDLGGGRGGPAPPPDKVLSIFSRFSQFFQVPPHTQKNPGSTPNANFPIGLRPI